MSDLTIFASAAESVNLPVIISTDPTGTVPSFALSAATATAPGAWTAGTWSSAYSGGAAIATSATIGSAATHVVSSGTVYSLWCKVAVGSETFVSKVGRIYCP